MKNWESSAPRAPARPRPSWRWAAVPVRQRRPAQQPAHRAALAGPGGAAGQRRGVRTDRQPHSARAGAPQRTPAGALVRARLRRRGGRRRPGAGAAGAGRVPRSRRDAGAAAPRPCSALAEAARAGVADAQWLLSRRAAPPRRPPRRPPVAAPEPPTSAGCGAPPTAACRGPVRPARRRLGTRGQWDA